MEPEVPTATRVRVGSFELELRSGELRSLASDDGADRVILREQPFQVLRMLLGRPGKIVTRSEIKGRLWPNDTIVDFDHSINVAIGVLRRALADSAASPRYIETLARRGYRLIAPVEWLNSASPVNEEPGRGEPASAPGLVGRKVGQYRVLEVLGGGGMGMVYKAVDLKLGRRVALKFLPVDLVGDTVALQRLEREAQTASALNHPNICTIYAIEDHERQSFIAMEFLEGVTLQERLAAAGPTPIPLRSVIDIAIQICAGLEAAHANGIVHRDIKPGNLFLTAQGPVKLLDFGVAKVVAGDVPEEGGVLERRAADSNAPVAVGLTRPDIAVGTAAYMSPEQVRKEVLDGRTDLFSLGLVLHEMVTGQRTFTGDTSVAVQEAILVSTPRAVETVNAAVTPALASVIARALEKDRDRRFQSAADMRRGLEEARAEAARSSGSRYRRWLPVVAAVAILAGVVGWLAWRQATQFALGANDTILLADTANSTANRVYDEALYTALRVGLEQTPYLNVLADHKARAALAALRLAPDTKINDAIALQICRQTGSRIAVTQAIADAGNRLRLELRGVDCQSGSTLSLIKSDAPSRNEVVATLGRAALELRKELGEPTASLATYNAPLEQATSSSPDAIELLTLGYRQQLGGSSEKAIPYYRRAVQADPSFGLAHSALSAATGNTGNSKSAIEAARTAYSLRDRLAAPARFNAESAYHTQVGDFVSACQILTQWVATFPHDFIARNNSASCLSFLGELDRAMGESREAARLLPAPFTYWMWIGRSTQADRFDEAQKALDDARARGFDTPLMHDQQAHLAFFRNDDAEMQRQWAWAANKPEAHVVMMGKAITEAHRGQFRAALVTQKAASSMAASIGLSAYFDLEMALMRASVGLPVRLERRPESRPFLSTRLFGAVVLARTGQPERARRLADAISLEYPVNTIVQKYGLPVIESTLKLQMNDAAGAVAALEPTKRFDLSTTNSIFPGLYASYARGTAYLQMKRFDDALAEFQRVLSHPGMAGRWVYTPLSRLQLARAQRGKGDTASARASYEDFLNLWRGADADIPILRDARAEYDSLRAGRN